MEENGRIIEEKRSSNWEEEEKRLLRQLVIARIDVIENKDSSTNTNNSKRAACQEVLSSFNSLNTKKRDLKEIMTQWRNAKGKVKSRDSEYKRARLMTGGGPPPPSPPAEDLVIMEALPNEFVVDSNCFDSDGLHNNSFSQPSTSGKSQDVERKLKKINKVQAIENCEEEFDGLHNNGFSQVQEAGKR